MKNPYCYLLLFIPFLLKSQDTSKFELELSYGVTNTLNQGALEGSLGSVLYEFYDEKNLIASNFTLSGFQHINRRHAFKIGLGIFQNGRKYSVIQTVESQSLDYPNVEDKYNYFSFNTSYLLKIPLPQNFNFQIENGISYLRLFSDPLKVFLQIPKKNHFQYFFKTGFSKGFFNKIITKMNFSLYKGLNDFLRKEIFTGSFKPLSLGGEISIAYVIRN